MLSAEFHRLVYLAGIAILLVGMPLSPVMMSVSQFVLLINWIVEANYKTKLETLKQNKNVLLLLGLFALHIIWLANTTDFGYGLNDIKAKLPLLIIPFVLGSSITISTQELNRFLILFISGIILASLACLFKLWGWIGEPIDDIREMSFIISHIRFGLMISFAIFASIFLLIKAHYPPVSKSLLGITSLWLLLFLAIMSAMTALLSTGLIFIGGGVLLSKKKTPPSIFAAITITSIAIVVGLLFWTDNLYNKQFDLVEQADVNKLDKKTAKGNNYYHSPNSISIENGMYVYHHICETEIAKAWKIRSTIPWNGKNANGKNLQGAMYRFITSKGLRKDQAGINALSAEEITAIENGVTNVDLINKSALFKRIHQTIWEFGNYQLGMPAGGSSVTQRFEFWKAALIISKENMFFGVGTGDVKQAYVQLYNKDDFGLGTKYRKRAHNQYLTFLVTFGLFGFVFFLVSMIYPITTKQHPLFYVFMVIILISFLNEDTLESQAGATFFAGFYGFFAGTYSSIPKNRPA